MGLLTPLLDGATGIMGETGRMIGSPEQHLKETGRITASPDQYLKGTLNTMNDGFRQSIHAVGSSAKGVIRSAGDTLDVSGKQLTRGMARLTNDDFLSFSRDISDVLRFGRRW